MCSRGAGHEVCASDLALAFSFEFIVGLGGLGLGVCESSCAVRKIWSKSKWRLGYMFALTHKGDCEKLNREIVHNISSSNLVLVVRALPS